MNQIIANTPEVIQIVKGLQTFLGTQMDDHLSPELAQKIKTFNTGTTTLTEAEFRVASSLLIRYMHFLAK